MIYGSALRPIVAIGAMDRKITIRSSAPDEYNELGEVIEVTDTDVEMWAHEMNKDKDEDNILEKETVMQIREFLIRWKQISYEDKVVVDGNEYDIIGINETMGRRRFIQLKVKRAV